MNCMVILNVHQPLQWIHFLLFSAYLRVCYYTNWSQYRPEGAKYFPEDIDVNLCSHLIYAFATMSGNRLKAYEWNDESEPWMVGM